MGRNYIGDYPVEQNILCWFDTNDREGASISPTIDPANILIYKDGVDTGETVDPDEYTEDEVTGVHKILLDVSDHVPVFTAGSDFALVLSTSTIDTQTVMATLVEFSIENRFKGVDVLLISGDSDAANNLKAMFNETGYLHDSAPASRDQMAALAGGVSVTQSAESSVVTQGTETGTYEDTAVHDANIYEIEDSGVGNGIDFYLQYDIGEGIPAAIHFHGYYNEGGGPFNNSLSVQVYDWNTNTWRTIETFTHATSEESHEIGLNISSGSITGLVRIRFLQTTQEASSVMYVNHCVVQFVTSAVTVADIVAGMKAMTGITEGGVWTWEKALKITTAWVAGNWRLKASDPTKQELLDADDGTTVILEQTLTRLPAGGSNYRGIMILI